MSHINTYPAKNIVSTQTNVSPFYFKADKTVRGKAGSCWNHSEAHHQDPAVPGDTDQPAVSRQMSGAGVSL